MTDDPNQLVYNFRLDLARFGEEVERNARSIFQTSAEVAALAVIKGNEWAPGIPVDTAWARDSYRIGVNQIVEGPSERPKSGSIHSSGPPMAVAFDQLQLGDTVYVATMAEYPRYLEFTPKRRRYGQYAGQSTEFLEPVDASWQAIIEDTVAKSRSSR